MPLIGNVLKTLTKSVFVPLILTTAASATDAAIQKKISGSCTTTLVFLNEDLNDVMKTAKPLIKSGLIIKGVSETVENEVKEQKVLFLGILVATLGASLLGNMLAGKGVIRAVERTVRADEG